MTSIMKIQPGKLSGSIGIQPSKSVGHRMAICAALSGAGAQVYTMQEHGVITVESDGYHVKVTP